MKREGAHVIARTLAVCFLGLATDGLVTAVRAESGEPPSVDAVTATEEAEGAFDAALDDESGWVAPDPAAADDGVEEFVVYGTQPMRDAVVRAESKVSFDMDDIEALGLQNVSDAFKLIPNTNLSPSRRGNNGITIRGVNSEGIAGGGANLRPLAAMVIDGSQQSFAALRRGALSLWDVRRFEVLPGPQSTLFGRNAAAGVVFVETADPTFHWEGGARGTTGWFDQADSQAPQPDQWETAFALSGPIYDDLAFRVSGQWMEDHHGITVGDPALDPLDHGEFQQIRAKLLFEPDFVEGLRVELSGFYTRNRPAVTIVTDDGQPWRWFDYHLEQDSIANEIRTTEVANVIVDMVWDPHPDVRVFSVTAWAGTEVDFDTPTDFFIRDETRVDSDVSQDLRVLWEPDERLQLLGGFFLASTHNEIDSFIEIDPFGTGNGIVLNDRFTERDSLNVALFAEGVWHFLESTSLTVGLRWDHDQYDVLTNLRDVDEQQRSEKSSDVIVPRFILAHDFLESHTASFTIARGYRPGYAEVRQVGIGGGVIEPQTIFVDPEFLWNYELGYLGRFFEDRVSVKLNGFYYDWHDMQLPVPVPGVAEPVVINVGKARGAGFEGSVGYEPIDGLGTQVSVGYLHTELLEVAGRPELEGNAFPEAPPFSAAAVVTYRHGSGAFGTLSWNYRDNFIATADLTNDPNKRVGSSSIFNLRLGYEWRESSLTFFINNILDSAIEAGRDDFNSVYVGDRRLIGLQLDLGY